MAKQEKKNWRQNQPNLQDGQNANLTHQLGTKKNWASNVANLDSAIPASSVLHDCTSSWKKQRLRLHDSNAVEKARTLQVLRSKQSGPNQVFSTCQWRCVSKKLGDKPKSQNLLLQAAHRQSR